TGKTTAPLGRGAGLVCPVGFEPTTQGLKVPCATVAPRARSLFYQGGPASVKRLCAQPPGRGSKPRRKLPTHLLGPCGPAGRPGRRQTALRSPASVQSGAAARRQGALGPRPSQRPQLPT